MPHNSLIHDCPSETRKEAISMEMQCLHAWKKSIICHFESVMCTPLPRIVPRFALSFLSLVFLFFCLFVSICSSRGKPNGVNAFCAWLSTNLFCLLLVQVLRERCLTSSPKSTPFRVWMGAFFGFQKHFSGLGKIELFPLHYCKVCQEFNSDLWSVKFRRKVFEQCKRIKLY